MSYNDDIAAEAYNATKPKEDPLFADCNLDFRQKLSTHAESVMRVGLPENPSEFEKCVKDFADHPDKARAAIVKTKETAARDAAKIMTEAGKRHVEEVDAQVAAEKERLAKEKIDEKQKETPRVEPVARQGAIDAGALASSASPRQGKLADDFPHRAALEAAGINTYAQARKAHESGWSDVHGIGDGKGKDIGDALKD